MLANRHKVPARQISPEKSHLPEVHDEKQSIKLLIENIQELKEQLKESEHKCKALQRNLDSISTLFSDALYEKKEL